VVNKKKVGLHLDNRCPIDEWTKRYMQAMDPTVIVFTENANREDVAWVYQNFPEAIIVARSVYQHWEDMEGYFASTYSLYLLISEYYPAKQVIIQLFNEPQFAYEGFGQSGDDIKRFYETWQWGHDWLRGQAKGAEMRFGFTPMAPGNQDLPIIEEPGRRTYLEYCQPLLAQCDYMLLHVYAATGEVDDPWRGGRVIQYKNWSQGKPIIITESAICADNQEIRGTETVRWFKLWVQNDPQIVAVAQWIGNIPGNPGQDPSFDANRHFEPGGAYRPVAVAMLAYLAEPEEPPEEGLPVSAASSLAVDIDNYDGELTEEALSAFRAAGARRVVVRLSTEDEAKITTAKQQIEAVLTGGFALDGYVWLYLRGADEPPEAQMQRVLSVYGDYPIGRYWLDCEEEPAGIEAARWIDRAVIALQPQHVGIYTRAGWWKQWTGNTTAFAHLPLWDANPNRQATLDDFTQYGGWTRCVMKQYDSQILAGKNVDLNVYREEAEMPEDAELAKVREELGDPDGEGRQIFSWKDAYIVTRGVADAWGRNYTKVRDMLSDMEQAMKVNEQNATALRQAMDDTKAEVDRILAGQL